MRGYSWTSDHIDEMHPYDILLALGWRRVDSPSAAETKYQHAEDAYRKRQAARQKGKRVPPLATK